MFDFLPFPGGRKIPALDDILCRRRVFSGGNLDLPIVMLGDGTTPTAAIYRPPQESCSVSSEFLDTSAPPEAGVVLPSGCRVVIMRHLPKVWREWLLERRQSIRRCSYLMDDDIPKAAVALELPERYREKTTARFLEMVPLLRQLQADLVVSTPELAARYAALDPEVWKPRYFPGPLSRQPEVYFYHGTEAHLREIEWLVPIVAAVQVACQDVWFEILCDAYVRKFFRGIPRVRSLHPLLWRDYLLHVADTHYTVGLAPLIETPFNMARSHVKFFDITRAGAAGIYSDTIPYRKVIQHGKTGLLLANEPDLWVQTICELLREPGKSRRMASEAFEWCRSELISLCCTST